MMLFSEPQKLKFRTNFYLDLHATVSARQVIVGATVACPATSELGVTLLRHPTFQ